MTSDWRKFPGTRLIRNSIIFIKKFKYAFNISTGCYHRVIEVSKILNWLPETPDITCKSNQSTDCNSFSKPVNAGKINKSNSQSRKNIYRRPDNIIDVYGMNPDLFTLAAKLVKNSLINFFAGKALGNLHTVKTFRKIGCKIRALIAFLFPGLMLFFLH